MVLLYVSNVNSEKWAFCHNICDRNVTEHPSLNIVVTVWILALVPEPLTFVLSIPSEMTPRRLAFRALCQKQKNVMCEFTKVVVFLAMLIVFRRY